jgi:hypothetical protein
VDDTKFTTRFYYEVMAIQPQYWIKYRRLTVVLIMIIMMYLFLYSSLHQTILSHNVYDTYTLQAESWWKGQTYLDQDYKHLELAFYDNRIYVSFPPFPSVIHFILIPFFDGKLPNNLLTTLYVILSFIFVYLLCKRKTDHDWTAILWAAFVVFGSNLVSLSVYGGVWFDAQTLSFLLTVMSIYYVTSPRPKSWYWGMILYAFAIGCRPFQLIYLPLYIWMLYQNTRSQHHASSAKGKSYSLMSQVYVYLIPFAAIGILYALYNYIRFDNPLEFGHNYLPEFVQAADGQFHLKYIAQNWPNLFALPTIQPDFSLSFPKFNGFAFYIANPIFILLFVYLFRNVQNRQRLTAWAIPALILIHILVTLSHKTLGGWQFGIRYFVDMIPFVFLYIYSSVQQLKIQTYQIPIMAFAVMINVYGTLWFYLNW